MNSLTGNEFGAVRRAGRRVHEVTVRERIVAVLRQATRPMSMEEVAKVAGCSRGAAVRAAQQHRLEQDVLGGDRIRLVSVLPTVRGYGTPVYEISGDPDAQVQRWPRTSDGDRWMDAAQRAQALDEQEAILAALLVALANFRSNPFGLHFVWMGVTA